MSSKCRIGDLLEQMGTKNRAKRPNIQTALQPRMTNLQGGLQQDHCFECPRLENDLGICMTLACFQPRPFCRVSIY